MSAPLDLSLITPAGAAELKRWLSEELQTLRAKNDVVHDDEKTDHIRGRIAQTKAFLGVLATREEKFPQRAKPTSLSGY